MHSEDNNIGDVTFYIIISLSLLGTVLSLLLCEAKAVKRSDGSPVSLQQSPTWKSEVLGLRDTLKHDTYIVLLFPMFFASNFFYPYQFNTFNLTTFKIRTRSLNNTFGSLKLVALTLQDMHWTRHDCGALRGRELL